MPVAYCSYSFVWKIAAKFLPSHKAKMPEKYNEMLLITVAQFDTLKNKPDGDANGVLLFG